MWSESAVYIVFMFCLYYNQSRAETIKTKNGAAQNKLPNSAKTVINVLDVIDVIKLILEDGKQNDGHENVLKRVKRQGAGKYAEAADMTETKQMRTFATLIGNLWSSSPAGGRHPLHPIVPKPVVLMFKEKIMDFFYPPAVGSKQQT